MILSRLQRAFASRPSRPAAVPEGMRVYAIGDVHGRDDRLAELAELIENDCRSAPGEVVTLCLSPSAFRRRRPKPRVTSLILKGAKLRALRHRQTVQLDMDVPAPPPSVARTGRAV
jgi:serine/threonine protein phosphatase 1